MSVESLHRHNNTFSIYQFNKKDKYLSEMKTFFFSVVRKAFMEKKKFLITSNNFFHNVFHRHSLQLQLINSLPNDKILNLPKLKAFADDKINVTQKLKFALRG